MCCLQEKCNLNNLINILVKQESIHDKDKYQGACSTYLISIVHYLFYSVCNIGSISISGLLVLVVPKVSAKIVVNAHFPASSVYIWLYSSAVCHME